MLDGANRCAVQPQRQKGQRNCKGRKANERAPGDDDGFAIEHQQRKQLKRLDCVSHGTLNMVVTSIFLYLALFLLTPIQIFMLGGISEIYQGAIAAMHSMQLESLHIYEKTKVTHYELLVNL